MDRTSAPLRALNRDRVNALALAKKLSKERLRALLERAQQHLQHKLRTTPGLSGAGIDTFTLAQKRIALLQVQQVSKQLGLGMEGLLKDAATKAAVDAAGGQVAYMEAMERRYAGITERLPLKEAAVLDRATRGANSSLLHRLRGDPKKGPGIMARYTDEVTESFEQTLQTRFIARTSWQDTRNAIQAASPFLQGKPASWSERIVRTEIMGVHGTAGWEAAREADDQLGDVVKILCATFDDRTGADSYAVHGQIRRVDEAFDWWDGKYMAPPNRPNDREIVVSHRVAWPIPAELQPLSDAAVRARWAEQGNKKACPPRPKMSTVDRKLFGKGEPPPKAAAAVPATPPVPAPVPPRTPAPAVLTPENHAQHMEQLRARRDAAQARLDEARQRYEEARAARIAAQQAAGIAPTPAVDLDETKTSHQDFLNAGFRFISGAKPEVAHERIQQQAVAMLGKPLSVAQVKRLSGVNHLEGEGRKTDVFIHANSGELGISAAVHQEGKKAPIAQVMRSFSRKAKGTVVHHDLFKLDPKLQGSGLGKKVLRDQFAEYEKMGVDEVTLTAAWKGRYVWPNMGFELSDPTALSDIKYLFKAHLARQKKPPSAELLSAIEAAPTMKDLVRLKHGGKKPAKDFLFKANPNWMTSYRLDVKPGNPAYETVKAYLNAEPPPARGKKKKKPAP